MIELLMGGVLGVFSLVIINEYVGIFFEKRFFRRRCGWLWNCCTIVMAVLLEINSGDPFINLALNYFFMLFICVVRYRGGICKKAFVVFTLLAIWMIVETLTGYGALTLGLEINETLYAGSIISKLILFIIMKCSHKYLTRDYSDKMSLRYWSVLLIFPISSILVVFCIFIIASNCGESKWIPLAMLASMLFFPLNLVVFWVYDKLVKETEIERMNFAYRQQLSLYDKQIDEQEESMLGLRRVRHDMKMHLLAIQQLASQNDPQAIQQYIERLMKDIKIEAGGIVKSGNAMVDALLNYQYEIAKRKNIMFRVRTEIPYKMEFENADLYIILGNALENAIEAATKVAQETERYIKVSLIYRNETLFIGIENSFDGLVRKGRQGELITTKKDTKYHGIGISSIEKAVKKYSGFLDISIIDNVFSLVATLYAGKNDMN